VLAVSPRSIDPDHNKNLPPEFDHLPIWEIESLLVDGYALVETVATTRNRLGRWGVVTDIIHHLEERPLFLTDYPRFDGGVGHGGYNHLEVIRNSGPTEGEFVPVDMEISFPAQPGDTLAVAASTLLPDQPIRRRERISAELSCTREKSEAICDFLSQCRFWQPGYVARAERYGSYVPNTISLDTVRSGHLLDDGPDGPIQSCTLTFEPRVGPVLSVPYLRGQSQFAATESWFRHHAPPSTLLFEDNAGTVTFNGVRWRGTQGLGVELGRLDANVVMLGRPRSIKAEYRFQEFRSTIDGLHEFSGFHSIADNLDDPSSAGFVTFTVAATEEVHWRHGGYSYRIVATAPWRIDGRELNARSGVALTSRRARGASIDDHLTAQWSVRALLLLVLGREIHWREHTILDEQFPTWMMSGEAHAPQAVVVLPRRTAQDREQAVIDHDTLVWALVHLRDLKAAGLRRWMKLYEDPIFRRAIEPTVEVVNGISSFLEPRLMMLALGLDAMGHFLDPTRKRNEYLNRQILRCINASGLDLGSIGPAEGIARALADMNNDIKHADRPNRPSNPELRLMVDLALLIMRFQLFELLGLPKRLRKAAVTSRDVNFLMEDFRLNGVKIDAAGNFVHK
jgi:hypothetical protein